MCVYVVEGGNPAGCFAVQFHHTGALWIVPSCGISSVVDLHGGLYFLVPLLVTALPVLRG